MSVSYRLEPVLGTLLGDPRMVTDQMRLIDNKSIRKHMQLPKLAENPQVQHGKVRSIPSICATNSFFPGFGEVFGLHANQRQKDRLLKLEKFAKAKRGILICTDVAARLPIRLILKLYSHTTDRF